VSIYVLVHGAFEGGWIFDDVGTRLRAEGHRVEVVHQLPSAGVDSSALGDLSADVDCVRRRLDATGEPVVLVGHSYGGMVITELANHPGVRHSVYLTALWPQCGQSVMNMYGDALPRSIVPHDDHALRLTDDFELAYELMCKDMDRDHARAVLSRFALQSVASMNSASSAPDHTHPTTYIIAELETAASVAAQEARAASADFVVRLKGGHMVSLTMPDELAAALARI
jgi:pimeloyl-ACP methyl ester carboxylesterase